MPLLNKQQTSFQSLQIKKKKMRNMFKVNDKDTTLKRRYWRRSGVFIVNFEHISHLVLVFLLLALNM